MFIQEFKYGALRRKTSGRWGKQLFSWQFSNCIYYSPVDESSTTNNIKYWKLYTLPILAGIYNKI